MKKVFATEVLSDILDYGVFCGFELKYQYATTMDYENDSCVLSIDCIDYKFKTTNNSSLPYDILVKKVMAYFINNVINTNTKHNGLLFLHKVSISQTDTLFEYDSGIREYNVIITAKVYLDFI